MKNFIGILIAIILMLPVSGCWEFMLTNDKVTITSGVEALMTKVDEFQTVFIEAAAVDLINAKETEKRNEQIDKIQEVMVAAKESIDAAPTLIEKAIAVNQASAPVNPYAGVIDAVLKIIAGSAVVGGTAAGVKIAKDGRAKKVTENKLKATNRANEKLRMAHPDIAKEHYELVGSERATV